LAGWQVNPQAEVNVIITDPTSMAELHLTWMGEPGPTDVLSFPMDELTEAGSWKQDPADPSPALLGDVYVCAEIAIAQAIERGHPFLHELRILAVHGLLHLLGYDHAEAETEREMFAKQDAAVAAFEARR
jgi:probable rRNA maturation factor